MDDLSLSGKKWLLKKFDNNYIKFLKKSTH